MNRKLSPIRGAILIAAGIFVGVVGHHIHALAYGAICFWAGYGLGLTFPRSFQLERSVVDAAQRIHESTVFFGDGKAEVDPKLMLDLKLACGRMNENADVP